MGSYLISDKHIKCIKWRCDIEQIAIAQGDFQYTVGITLFEPITAMYT